MRNSIPDITSPFFFGQEDHHRPRFLNAVNTILLMCTYCSYVRMPYKILCDFYLPFNDNLSYFYVNGYLISAVCLMKFSYTNVYIHYYMYKVIYTWLFNTRCSIYMCGLYRSYMYTKLQQWIGILIYTARALPFENLILAKETTGKCDYFELKFQH